MTEPIDLVLQRLEGSRLRPQGRDRWRACCPGHGGTNPSALSIGVGHDGAVLLRCWHGCPIDRVVEALGLELHDLFPSRPAVPGEGSQPMKRRRMLTAAQALELLEAEMTFAAVAMNDLAHGRPLDETTRKRLVRAAARVLWLREETHA